MAKFNRTGKRGSLLDNGVAALAALSGSFLVYAMPDGLFSRIIVASRLPSFLAAAQPPLGMKARLVVIAAIALVVYAFIWSLMRALDGIGRKPVAAAEEPEAEAPRLRRADAHPDAPSRRPIFAGRDLGEPDHEEEPLELETEAAFAPEPEADEAPEPQSEPLPAFLVAQEPEPEAVEEPEPAAIVDAPVAFHEESFALPAAHAASGEDDFEEDEEVEEEGSEGDDQSLTRLMQRFESGLGRKQQALDAAPQAAEPEPEAEPIPQERVGHRLRSAISDLNKMSAPGR
ncbi:MAG: hypothetical protein JWO81_256 [Alphaproteobacteria bacterium]|nr:hypothetical protein [Alphaproteobacteria bacterium]